MNTTLQHLLDLQEASWQSDQEPIYVEGLVADHPHLCWEMDAVLHLFQREVVLRRQRGEPVDSSEYAGRIQELLTAPSSEVAFAEPSAEDLPATIERAEPSLRWANFAVQRTLKEDGRMGWVVLAHDLEVDRDVVLKILPATNSGSPLAEVLEHEPFLMARQSHPHVVQVFGVGTHPDSGRLFFSMEYLAAGSLADPANRAAFKERPREALALLLPLARTLADCHARQLVHNDIKPSNILLDAAGNAKLADFGLAGLADALASVSGGTRFYSAPEKARRLLGLEEAGPSGEYDPRKADVYALGLVLYELLAGQPAVTPENFDDLCRQPGWRPVPPRKLNRNVSRDLEAVCLRALHPDPGQRYSAEVFAEQLRRVLGGNETDAREWGLVEWAWARSRRHPWWTLFLGLLLGSLMLLVLARVVINGARAEAVHLSEGIRRLVHWGSPRDATWVVAEWDSSEVQLHVDRASTSPPGRIDPRTDDYRVLAHKLEQQQTFREEAEPVTAVACTPDGKLLAAQVVTGQARVWDVKTGKVLRQTMVGPRAVGQIAFRSDGQVLELGLHTPDPGPDGAANPAARVLEWDLTGDWTNPLLDPNPVQVQLDPEGELVVVIRDRMAGRLKGIQVRLEDGRLLYRWARPQ